jgi:hypothetical protein
MIFMRWGWGLGCIVMLGYVDFSSRCEDAGELRVPSFRAV